VAVFIYCAATHFAERYFVMFITTYLLISCWGKLFYLSRLLLIIALG